MDGDLRLLEALLFAAAEPVDAAAMAARLPEATDLPPLLAALEARYANRGVNLVRLGSRWAFRTAPDLAPRLRLEKPVARKLSRAAMETLAIIAYHQPVTRPELEEIRGVGLSRGSLSPGRPVTWVTTDGFLEYFGLTGLDDLPGVEELKKAGLLARRPTLTAPAIPNGEPATDAAEGWPQAETNRSDG